MQRSYVLRASSSGFAWGSMVFTRYKTACLRKIKVQAHRNEDLQINPDYAAIGKLNEDRHAARLDPHLPFEREKLFSRRINGTHVTQEGHCDFLITDLDGNATRVDELKAVRSVNTRREIIRNGQYLPENLAQLVTYMSAFNAPRGRLIYTFYPENNVPDEERAFHVELDDYGRVIVDGEATKFTYYDLLCHRDQAAAAIEADTIPQRPYLWDAPFISPCAYCPYSDACDAFDMHELSDEKFLTACKEIQL